MPIRRILKGSSFAPESVEEISKAVEAVIKKLGITDVPSQEIAAKVILGLAAEKRVLDAHELRDEAISKLKGIHGHPRK
jgi:hypothetical protein